MARQTFSTLQAWQHRGTDVRCPCCGSSYASFATFRQRENSRCYFCNSLERHRFLALNLKSFLQTQRTPRVLHFAPDSLRPMLEAAAQRYVPTDLMPAPGLHQMDIRNIDFEDESFDAIVCSHVLEHIDDDAKAMSELRRVLSATGVAFIMVPQDFNRATTYEDWSITTPEGREKAFGQDDHVRWYGRDFESRLLASGFNVETRRPGAGQIRAYGLSPDEIIYLCTRPSK